MVLWKPLESLNKEFFWKCKLGTVRALSSQVQSGQGGTDGFGLGIPPSPVCTAWGLPSCMVGCLVHKVLHAMEERSGNTTEISLIFVNLTFLSCPGSEMAAQATLCSKVAFGFRMPKSEFGILLRKQSCTAWMVCTQTPTAEFMVQMYMSYGKAAACIIIRAFLAICMRSVGSSAAHGYTASVWEQTGYLDPTAPKQGKNEGQVKPFKTKHVKEQSRAIWSGTEVDEDHSLKRLCCTAAISGKGWLEWLQGFLRLTCNNTNHFCRDYLVVTAVFADT